MFKNVLNVSLGDIIAGAADYALARAAVDETGRFSPNNWKQINEQPVIFTHKLKLFQNSTFHFISHLLLKFTCFQNSQLTIQNSINF